MHRILTLLKALGARTAGFSPGTGGGIDSLLQAFENCRAGLSDEAARAGGAAVGRYFADVYEKERAHFENSLQGQSLFLSERARVELVARIDDRIRTVLIPAYCRLAAPVTLRERNDFFLLPHAWHGLERVGWALAGMATGAFAVSATFIPLWEKEWVLVFIIAGFFFPSLRRYAALKRYEGELNRLAARVEDEITRLDLALMTSAASSSSSEFADREERVVSKEENTAGHAAPPSDRRRATKEGR